MIGPERKWLRGAERKGTMGRSGWDESSGAPVIVPDETKR